MNNTLILTDDELATIQTSLLITLESNRKYVEVNGEDDLDYQTKEVVKKIQAIYNKFDEEYF